MIITVTKDMTFWVCRGLLFLTPVSMQTTHSELPGPSTGLGAEGVTGVPGEAGGLGIWKVEALGSNGGEVGGGAVGLTSSSSSCWTALQAPGRGGENQWTVNKLTFH